MKICLFLSLRYPRCTTTCQVLEECVMKIYQKILYVCLLIAPFLLSALFYSRYPDQVAVHWSSQGIADSFVSRNFAAWGIPAILLAIVIFFQMSRQNRTDQNGKVDLLFAIGTWGVAAVPIIVQSVILFMVGELVFKWGFLISIFFGVLMVLTGIFIPRLEDKISAAYATSWAASDPVNKKATLQCASIVWTICGILICLSVFLLVHPIVVGRIDILVFSCILFIPRFYSLYYFKKYGKKNK